MSTCKDCLHNDVCHFNFKGCELTEEEKKDCGFFKPKADYVEVVRCKDCKHAVPLDKHCELSSIYKHCSLLRGESENYVWHKYKKYYKNYSIVEDEDFCSYGERKESEVQGE